jgi:hypothetical protein
MPPTLAIYNLSGALLLGPVRDGLCPHLTAQRPVTGCSRW